MNLPRRQREECDDKTLAHVPQPVKCLVCCSTKPEGTGDGTVCEDGFVGDPGLAWDEREDGR